MSAQEQTTPNRYRLFNPDELARKREPKADQVRYVYEDGLKLAINVAMAAGRPLLLRGVPGSGKTTLAADVAFLLNRRFETEVITSKTQAQDLQWHFDAVRRLADAQGDPQARARAQEPAKYLRPGVLWRAFNPSLASDHGATIAGQGQRGVVILLDEIDKADPDVPNDLLMVLDQGWFQVPDLHVGDGKVQLQSDIELLMIITSNGERELAPAFLRRCVAYDLPDPDDDRLRKIGRAHFGAVNEPFLNAVIGLYRSLLERARSPRRRAPGTAEFVDALRACGSLGITKTDSPDWQAVAEAAMWKHSPPENKSP